MKILLVYPYYPTTFWSFRNAMKFIDRKASFPPLGLMTVAAMLPESWDKRLVDMNVRPLEDDDLLWADYVFISAMTIQRPSVREVIERCRRLEVKTVAGGPLFTACHEDFPEVDHLVLGEAEMTLPLFLKDLRRGMPRRLYVAEGWAPLDETPAPLWDLVAMKDYAAMNIQYGRGCPFDCEFCDITALFGRKPRSKPLDRILAELQTLYVWGWKGAVFKTMLFLGVLGKERFHYWKLFFWSLFRKPRLFPLAITYAVYGFHFRKVAEKIKGCGMFDGNEGWDAGV